MGFPRQEYWSGLPFPPSGDLPDPGIEPVSPAWPALQADSLPLSHLGSLYSLSVHLAYFFQGWIPPLCSLAEHSKELVLGTMLKGTADFRLPSHTHQDGAVCSRLKRRWSGYLQNSHKLKVLQLYSRPEQFPPISIYPNFISKYILLNHLRGTNGQILSLVGFSLGMGFSCSTLMRKLNGRDLDAHGGAKIPPKSDQYWKQGIFSRLEGSTRPAHL